MSVIDKAKGIGRRFTVDMRKSITGEAEKRAGLIVKRPVLNGEDWHDWAVKHGIPSPVAADDMHVTVIYSPDVDVKIKPQSRPMIFCTEMGSFHFFGADEDVFVLALGGYETWDLHDRHYFLLTNGATTKWPTYRPHFTVSYSAPGFEISDEALADSPTHLILGGEVFDEPKADFDAKKSGENPEGLIAAGLEVVSLTDAVREAAKSVLEARVGDFNAVDQSALYEIANSTTVAVGVLARFNATDDSGVAEIRKALITVEGKKSHEIVVDLKQVTAEVAKAMGLAEAFKENVAEQMVVTIASVSTVDGELVKDFHGDTITTQALIEFSRDIVRGTRASQFDHNGDNRLEIVQSFVLSEDIQKALGIDLGYEPYLVEIHVPDQNDWAKVLTGDWGASIRGTMYIEDPA